VNEKKTWLEANSDCNVRYRGSHLMYLQKQSLYGYSKPLLNISKSEKYFLGARKNASGWFWSNGVKLSSSYWYFKLYKQDGTFLVGTYASYGYFIVIAVDAASECKYICELDGAFVQTSANGKFIYMYNKLMRLTLVGAVSPALLSCQTDMIFNLYLLLQLPLQW
jgi:hypothetical protein